MRPAILFRQPIYLLAHCIHLRTRRHPPIIKFTRSIDLYQVQSRFLSSLLQPVGHHIRGHMPLDCFCPSVTYAFERHIHLRLTAMPPRHLGALKAIAMPKRLMFTFYSLRRPRGSRKAAPLLARFCPSSRFLAPRYVAARNPTTISILKPVHACVAAHCCSAAESPFMHFAY